MLAALATIAIVVVVGVLAMARTGGALLPAPAGRQTVAAPVDGLDVRVMESFPPQYMLNIRAGLPSGCAQQDSHAVSRVGGTITVTVLNSMPNGDPPCTMIYGSYELNINLGIDFLSGSTYTVQVNDKTTTFTAQ
jgi:SecD/SecF GG-like protein